MDKKTYYIQILRQASFIKAIKLSVELHQTFYYLFSYLKFW